MEPANVWFGCSALPQQNKNWAASKFEAARGNGGHIRQCVCGRTSGEASCSPGKKQATPSGGLRTRPGINRATKEAGASEHATQSDTIWFQSNTLSPADYYKIIMNARKYDISVRYFSFAIAEKCVEQLALRDMGFSLNNTHSMEVTI